MLLGFNPQDASIWDLGHLPGDFASRSPSPIVHAEALFATAMGLVAAIPAVVAYNKFTVELGRLAGRMHGLIGSKLATLLGIFVILFQPIRSAGTVIIWRLPIVGSGIARSCIDRGCHMSPARERFRATFFHQHPAASERPPLCPSARPAISAS